MTSIHNNSLLSRQEKSKSIVYRLKVQPITLKWYDGRYPFVLLEEVRQFNMVQLHSTFQVGKGFKIKIKGVDLPPGNCICDLFRKFGTKMLPTPPPLDFTNVHAIFIKILIPPVRINTSHKSRAFYPTMRLFHHP